MIAQQDSTTQVIPRDFSTLNYDSSFLGKPRLDSIKYPVDGIGILSDTTKRSKQAQKESDIETTINYTARDSLIFSIDNQHLYMYGKTHIDYGSISLDAERTDVNMETRTITSTFMTDTAGKKVGRPVFSDTEDSYETDMIVYNFNTKRAQIKGVVTAQDGAFMHGDDVKKNEHDEMYIRGARYTTCNLSDPHFFIDSQKLKVIPGNKVVSGPFNLRFREVVTPLWFPFGMFPQPKRNTSGIVFPSYGEERRRGFFLRDGGYYLSINDYLDLRATGDIYSKGGVSANVTSNYKVRYQYSGAFNFSYTKNVSLELENPLESKDYWIRWNHRPETRGSSSFSASVSAGTSTYNQNTNLVNRDFNTSINSQFASNVSYSKTFQGTPFNMSLNARHSQNLQTGLVFLSLPEMTVNMNRIYPLKEVVENSKSPLAKLNFSHNFTARNELTNQIPSRSLGFIPINEGSNVRDTLDFNLNNLSQLYDRSKIGGRHQVPVNTSISVLKNFTLNPFFNYQEVWYTRELDYTWVEEAQGVQVDTLNGFSRAGSWQSGASLNTIIYGTYFFKRSKNIQAIRHVMTPSISFSYNPDFGDPSRGVYQDVQVDSLGRTRRLSKYEGFAYGSPSGNRNQSMSFSLQNNVELKVRDKNDTTGVGFKKIKVFDNLSVNSGYNFGLDSFQLSNLRWSTRTSFFKGKLSFNLNGSVDPYQYELISESVNSRGDRVVQQSRIDRFAWQDGQGLGKLNQVNTAISLNLSPKGSRQTTNNGNPNQNINQSGAGIFGDPNFTDPNAMPGEIEYIQRNPNDYIDFNIPWNLSVSYSINRVQNGFQDALITQTLRFNGDFSLTEKTKITFNSGYDLEQKDFTLTNIGVSRDLHCWSMNFSWVPFGNFQQFNLVIRPKSSLLQDLKLERRKSFFDLFSN